MVKHYNRQSYNLLDWIGDVGGLFDGLTILGGIIMSAYNLIVGNPLQVYLLNSIMKVAKKPIPNSN